MIIHNVCLIVYHMQCFKSQHLSVHMQFSMLKSLHAWNNALWYLIYIYILLIWKCKCFSYGKKHILNAKEWNYFDKDEWELKINSLGGCKDGGRVGSYGVDGTAVGLDFSQLVTVLNVPQLEEAPSTTTEQYVVWWHELQSTDPVLVGRIYRLQIDSQNAHLKYR